MQVLKLEKKDSLSIMKMELKTALTEWIKKPANTKGRLCRETGITNTLYYKVLDGNPDLTRVSAIRVIKMISILFKLSESEAYQKYKEEIDFIKSFKPDSDELNFDIEQLADAEHQANLNKIVNSKEKFIIYSLAASNEGTTFKECKSILGESASEMMYEFISKGIIVLGDDNRYHIKTEKTVFFDRDQVQASIPHLNSMYRSSRANKERNFNILHTNKINIEALRAIHKVLTEANNAISGILADQESQGQIPFYTFMQMDTFKQDLISEEE